ncbi:unnamed protein product, partial [Pylaiella littoralis]
TPCHPGESNGPQYIAWTAEEVPAFINKYAAAAAVEPAVPDAVPVADSAAVQPEAT